MKRKKRKAFFSLVDMNVDVWDQASRPVKTRNLLSQIHLSHLGFFSFGHTKTMENQASSDLQALISVSQIFI